jgi:hypothetical protein
MCYSAGWRIEKHLRFVSDLTGNGRVDLDLIGFSDRGMFIALNNGNGTFQEPKLVLKNNAGGWRVEKNPRFIADLTGNKAGDLVGFGNNGVYVAINNGDGTFQLQTITSLTMLVTGGLRSISASRLTWRAMGGIGCADIVGFGERMGKAVLDLSRNFLVNSPTTAERGPWKIPYDRKV